MCSACFVTPEHTVTTNALCVSDSAGNVLSTNSKEKLGLEQRSGATDFRSKGYRVSTCGFHQTFVSGPDHCRVLIIHRGTTHTHQACSSRKTKQRYQKNEKIKKINKSKKEKNKIKESKKKLKIKKSKNITLLRDCPLR